MEKRLGSLSQRLSASVGQLRINTDLQGDSAATQSRRKPDMAMVKTPWGIDFPGQIRVLVIRETRAVSYAV